MRVYVSMWLKTLGIRAMSIHIPSSDIPLPDPRIFFHIKVVDDETGRGIPLVKVRGKNLGDYYTDSAGNVAFYEPEVINAEVFFYFESHGYVLPEEATGFHGRALRVIPGEQVVIRMKRINIAQRLYRITGLGIYRDTVMLGEKAPIEQPLNNANVLGQDSTLVAIYKGKLFWVWGDTGNIKHPHAGNYKVTCARSLLPGKGGLDPEVGVNLEYFRKDDFVKEMVPLPVENLVWLGSLLTVPDSAGNECLLAHYVKIKPPLECVGRGLARFNEEKDVFEEVCAYPMDDKIQLGGHPWSVFENGEHYIYIWGEGMIRTKLRYDLIVNHEEYEVFTCLKEGKNLDENGENLELDRDGALQYSWKRNTAPISRKQIEDLLEQKKITPADKWFQFIDVLSGKEVKIAGGSVYWNNYRKRWVLIFNEIHGTSMLGEIWYAEGDTPLGPWHYARKIVTHNTYCFYNVVQHPHFSKENGKILFFEGTYTTFISGALVETPLYEYNQIMYKLDLGDEHTALPVPVYLVDGEMCGYHTADTIDKPIEKSTILCMAFDRKIQGSVPVYEYQDTKSNSWILTTNKPVKEKKAFVAFYVLENKADERFATTCPLYRYIHKDTQTHRYSTYEDIGDDMYERDGAPVCRVWLYSLRVNPISLYSEGRGQP